MYTKLLFLLQKQQDVFHVAARKGQLECLKLLCKKSPPGALDLLTIDKVLANPTCHTCTMFTMGETVHMHGTFQSVMCPHYS